jgi:hypothetical protein
VQTAGGTDAFTCQPGRILRREKNDHRRDFLRRAESCREGRSCCPRITRGTADKAAVSVAFGIDQPRRYDIYAYIARPSFFASAIEIESIAAFVPE